MKKWFSTVITLFFLLLLFLKLRELSFPAVKDALYSINLFYFIAAMLLMVLSALMQAVRWRFILLPLGKYKLMDIFSSVAIGHWFNLVLPARLGELARPLNFARKHNLPYTTVLATTLIERLADAFAILLLFAFGGLILGRNLSANFGIAFFVATLLSLVGLSFVIKNRVRLLLWFSAKIKSSIVVKHSSDFLAGTDLVRSSNQFVGVVSTTLFIWLSNTIAYGLLLHSCNLPEALTTPAAAILVTLASAVAHSIPSTASGLGVFNYSVVVAMETYCQTINLNHLSFSPSIIALSLTVYVAAILPDIVIGGYFYWRNTFYK